MNLGIRVIIFVFAIISPIHSYTWGWGWSGLGGRTNVNGPFQNQHPVVLPCDGSNQITYACDTFCKAIGGLVGSCLLEHQLCGCTWPVPQQPSVHTGVSEPPSTSGIHIIQAPDLSQSAPPTNSTVADETTPVALPILQRRKRRMRRQTLEPVVQGPGSSEPTRACTNESCSSTCNSKGYGTCSAECVKLSCYCRCASVDRPATNAPATNDLNLSFTQRLDISEAFRPPLFSPNTGRRPPS